MWTHPRELEVLTDIFTGAKTDFLSKQPAEVIGVFDTDLLTCLGNIKSSGFYQMDRMV
jgi:hypothetical protein